MAKEYKFSERQKAVMAYLEESGERFLVAMVMPVLNAYIGSGQRDDVEPPEATHGELFDLRPYLSPISDIHPLATTYVHPCHAPKPPEKVEPSNDRAATLGECHVAIGKGRRVWRVVEGCAVYGFVLNEGEHELEVVVRRGGQGAVVQAWPAGDACDTEDEARERAGGGS